MAVCWAAAAGPTGARHRLHRPQEALDRAALAALEEVEASTGAAVPVEAGPGAVSAEAAEAASTVAAAPTAAEPDGANK